MLTPERRVTPRFNLHTPLSFRRMEAPSKQEQARAINISTRCEGPDATFTSW